MALLEVSHVSRTFDGVQAVNDVSFTVDRDEFVSIIGPNGAGKTTLFNLIAGTDRPTGGSIRLDGQPLIGLPTNRFASRGVARTFQHGRVFSNLSVLDNVLIGAQSRRQAVRSPNPIGEWLYALYSPPRAAAEESAFRVEAAHILARFGDRLTPRLNDPANSLSYANRRRLELARALALHPRLLLLDEPTAGMNPTETDEMLEIIRTLKGSMTILLIEHKLSLVNALSDRVIAMDNGQIIAEGTPEQVRRDRRVIEAYLGQAKSPHPNPSPKGEGLPIASLRTPPLSLAERGLGGEVNSLLSLTHIDTFYGAVQVHFDLSLHVQPGEIVCLLGGNASGKSTTMKLILGLLKPRAGQIDFNGVDLIGQSTPHIVRLGIASVPEARRIFGEMTVRENLLMGAYQRADRTAIDEDYTRILDLFPRLKERIGQRGGVLSGGEQQMLAIGRALMSRPKLICMDEPTMGLSPAFVDRVLELIQAINAQGTAIFMVEQNANLALQIAHRGYVLQAGHIVLEGAASDLLNSPAVQEAYLGG